MQDSPFIFPKTSSAPPPASPRPTTARSRKRESPASFALPALATIALAYLSMAGTSVQTQVSVSIALVVLLLVFRWFRKSLASRVIFLVLSSFIILRYIFWRTLYTVEFTDWVSFSCAIILYLAEIYGVLVALMGNFVNVAPMSREPMPLPEDPQECPTVDVMVPSYNEHISLLETTLLGAVQMEYPEGRYRVYLLDDGATDQKCQRGTREAVLAARERRESLQKLCATLGVTYLTRPANKHAKAGNINEALAKTDGELIAILDADHVPTTDFLQKTVGFFLHDPKLFLVQTPHFLVNPDPIERNLDTFHQMPGENDMFYREIQRGLDFWNSAFFCGSGALLRRRPLESNGGLATDTVTEDAETALHLHSQGYHSVYLSKPLISGLAAETMNGFICQRTRWAQGMIQMFMLKCPLFMPGLQLSQRICYFNSCFFWFFPFARIVYMVAPAAFLIFGLRIYAANVETFFAYAIPYLVVMFGATHYLFGKTRWAFVSELYELIQSIHTIPAVISTLMRPRAPTFKVTPKQETLEEDYISPVAIPFYILALLNFTAIGFGVYELMKGPAQIYPLTITLFWGTFNSIILITALGALYERRQVRAHPRIPVDIAAELVLEDTTIPCRIENLSMGGCRLYFPWGSEHHLDNRSQGHLRAFVGQDTESTAFPVTFRNYRDEAGEGFTLGVAFALQTLEEKKARVRFVTGDSQRWAEVQDLRQSHVGVLKAFLKLARIGFARFIPHLSHLTDSLFTSRRKDERPAVAATAKRTPPPLPTMPEVADDAEGQASSVPPGKITPISGPAAPPPQPARSITASAREAAAPNFERLH